MRTILTAVLTGVAVLAATGSAKAQVVLVPHTTTHLDVVPHRGHVHVVPHTQALYQKYAKDGLVIVGVHTPEYDEEHDLGGVASAIRQMGITYPVAVDNSYATWNAYKNRFWPALYLIDQNGKIVYSHYGEGNYDETETRVRRLLGKA